MLTGRGCSSFISTPFSRPLLAASALPKPSTINPWVRFPRGPLFYCEDLHHCDQLPWFNSDLGVETNHSHLVTSACTLYCPSAPLVAKKARPPSQRPVPEIIKFIHTRFIVRSHSSRSLYPTFPFLVEDARQSLCSGDLFLPFGYNVG